VRAPPSRSARRTGNKPTPAGIEKHGSGDPLGSKKTVVLKIDVQTNALYFHSRVRHVLCSTPPKQALLENLRKNIMFALLLVNNEDTSGWSEA
jgi:hypothetical protein